MKILYPHIEHQSSSKVYQVILDICEQYSLPASAVCRLGFEDYEKVRQADGAIIEIHDPQSYMLSLNFINQVIEQEVPYVTLVTTSGNFSWKPVIKSGTLLQIPFSDAELKDAISKLLTSITQDKVKSIEGTKAEPAAPLKIWLPIKRGVYHHLDIMSIKYITAKDHHIKIHCDSEVLPEIKISLKSFFDEYLSKSGGFYLLKRDCIINLRRISKVESGVLFMDDGHSENIPKERRDAVLKHIGLKRMNTT